MSNNAKEWFEKISSQLFMDDPIMLKVMSSLDKVENKNRDTMGINVNRANPTMEYNPEWVESISFESFEQCVINELFKVLLKHPTSRLLHPLDVSSLASQITITETGDNTALHDLIKDISFSASNWNMPEHEYLEEYFRRLNENKEEMEDKLQQMFGDDPRIGMGQEDGDEEQDGQGQGQGQGGNSEQDALKKYADPRGDASKDWGENELFDKEIKNIVDDAKSDMKQWGKYTGSAMSQIVAAHEPKVSPKEVLKRFKRSVTTYDRYPSRMKRNRRYGLRLPGSRTALKQRILFAIDVSGSMDNETIANAYSITNAVLKHCEMDVLQIDTEIKHVDYNVKKKNMSVDIHGRGGTDMNKLIDFVNDAKGKMKYDGVVLCSDMYWPTVKAPKNTKMLCIATENVPAPIDGSHFYLYWEKSFNERYK
jgi:predicted metal-dependent peptidase